MITLLMKRLQWRHKPPQPDQMASCLKAFAVNSLLDLYGPSYELQSASSKITKKSVAQTGKWALGWLDRMPVAYIHTS